MRRALPTRRALAVAALLTVASGGCLEFPAAPEAVVEDVVEDIARPACEPLGEVPRCAARATCVDYGDPSPDDTCRVCGPDGDFVACAFGCVEGVCAAPVDVTAGEQHACVVTDVGEVWCWGQRAFGVLGDGVDAVGMSRPVRARLDRPVVEVRAARAHTCARDADGGVWCWGANSLRQCGQPTSGVVLAPARVPLAVPATRIAPMNGSTTCVERSVGPPLCWGFTLDGQHYAGPQGGQGTADPAAAPVGDEQARAYAVATTYGCGVDGEGLRCWGRPLNVEGEAPGPWALEGVAASRVSAVAVSFDGACAVLDGNEVRCWGTDQAGELGLDDPGKLAAPRALDPPLGVPVTALGMGPRHTCALTANGQVRCWGLRLRGQSGALGFAEPSHVPVEVPLLTMVSRLAVGQYFSCALDAGGFVWCWGDNEEGQLGDGTGEPSHTGIPRRVGR